MREDEAALRHARQVSTSLAALVAGDGSCPETADRFDWSSDVLDELARALSALGDVVEALTGGPDDEIATRAAALATAVVRRRNELLRDAPPPRHRLHRTTARG